MVDSSVKNKQTNKQQNHHPPLQKPLLDLRFEPDLWLNHKTAKKHVRKTSTGNTDIMVNIFSQSDDSERIFLMSMVLFCEEWFTHGNCSNFIPYSQSCLCYVWWFGFHVGFSFCVGFLRPSLPPPGYHLVFSSIYILYKFSRVLPVNHSWKASFHSYIMSCKTNVIIFCLIVSILSFNLKQSLWAK